MLQHEETSHFEIPIISKIHTGRKWIDGFQELWEERNRDYANKYSDLYKEMVFCSESPL